MTHPTIDQRLAAFERQYDYDASYAHEMLATSPEAGPAFEALQSLGALRLGLPLEVWFAARLLASAREDCGPCTQLTATMALREGVSADLIAHVLERAWEALPDDVGLAVRYVDAALSRSTEADALRPQVEARFGREGLVALAFGVVASRSFPTLKYVLGYGQHCSRLQIGDRLVQVDHARQ